MTGSPFHRARTQGRRRARAGAVLAVAVLLAAACSGDDDGTDAASSTTEAAGASTTHGADSTTTTADDGGGAGDVTVTPLLLRQDGPDVRVVKGSDGAFHVLYSTILENVTSLELTVTEVEVLDGDEVVLDLQGDDAAAVVEVLGTREAAAEIGPAQVASAFLTLSFASEDEVPTTLTHRVTVAAEQLPGGGATTTGAETTVDPDLPVPVLGPPLAAGSGYVAADGCCTSTRHIRAPIPLDNQLFFAQRYAIDWEQVNDADQFSEGDPSQPESYLIYGTDTLAAADGTVVSVLDGLDDQVPGELPGTALALDQVDGNSVVIDIGDGLYVMYAHMQNGSIQVAEGDEVTQGTVLGKVGNTGNSSAPHLHLHVMDGPSPLASNGVPYVIDSFEITSAIASTDALDEVENEGEPADTVPAEGSGAHTDELPLDLSIVTFP